MSWPEKTQKTLQHLKRITQKLAGRYVQRDDAVNLLLLATVCREHLLLIGPPGTAKTEILTRFAELVDARCFHHLLTRFTEPSELFGPLDMKSFQKGTYHIRTEDMLPEAELAFLDEVFQGSSAILNTLLALVNERIFHNGAHRQPVPLMSLVGATNSLPSDPSLRAFADRFTLRLAIDPVAEEHLEELLLQGWELESDRVNKTGQAERGEAVATRPVVKLEDLRALHTRLVEVDLVEALPVYLEVVREARASGVEISDRRVIKGLKLIAGSALLRGEDVATPLDLKPIRHFWSRPEEGEILRDLLEPRIGEAGGELEKRGRPVKAIALELEQLKKEVPRLVTEAALGTHLKHLNRLRLEILAHHRGEEDLRLGVEAVIDDMMGRIGAAA